MPVERLYRFPFHNTGMISLLLNCNPLIVVMSDMSVLHTFLKAMYLCFVHYPTFLYKNILETGCTSIFNWGGGIFTRAEYLYLGTQQSRTLS
jgi:hypothetical protein